MHNVASIQIPDLSVSQHQVSYLYKNLALHPDFLLMFNAFLNAMFVQGYTRETFAAINAYDTERYKFAGNLNPAMTCDMADKYFALYMQFIDLIGDKYESYIEQAQIAKQILTGNPLLLSVNLEIHYTGWYVVIF